MKVKAELTQKDILEAIKVHCQEKFGLDVSNVALKTEVTSLGPGVVAAPICEFDTAAVVTLKSWSDEE